MPDELFTEMINRGFISVAQVNLTLGIVNSVLLEMDWVAYLVISRN